MNLYQEISIIPHFFSITYVENSGAAFSILENHTIFLIVISILFLLGIDHFIKKQCLTFPQYEIISFGMIISGIFGNLFDQIYYRKVIDYLSFQFGNYFFPIFNFADTCIVLGVILYGFTIIFYKEK
jgi:signal peptidase II